MILIFDYFETIALTKVMDFNLGLRPLWEKYYQDKCSFEEIAAFGEELYGKLQEFQDKMSKTLCPVHVINSLN